MVRLADWRKKTAGCRQPGKRGDSVSKNNLKAAKAATSQGLTVIPRGVD